MSHSTKLQDTLKTEADKCPCLTKVAQEAASALSDSTGLIELQEKQCWTEVKAPM